MTAAMTAVAMPEPLPPAPLTFAALAERIAADSTLPAWRRQWDPRYLRCFCAHLGLDPAATPADLRPLGARIKAFRPRRAGISRKYWSTVLSGVRRSLRYAGLPCPPKRSVTPLSPAWAALLAGTDRRDQDQARLRRFARWCTGRGTAPAEVDQAVVDAFRDDLAAAGLDATGARAAHYAVIRTWTKAAAVPGWPKARLALGPHPTRWTPALDVLAPGPRAEFEAFLAWAARDDPLDDAAPTRPVRPATAVGYRYRMRCYLGALAATGHPPAGLRALADLLEPERARAALRWLHARADAGNARGPYLVGCLLRSLGDYLRIEPDRRAELAALCKRLRPKARKRLAAKNRERLLPFVDDRHLGTLLHLPDRLMRNARRGDLDDRRAALDAQIAVAIAVLLAAPVRIANLVSLDLDRHFVFSRTARGGRGAGAGTAAPEPGRALPPPGRAAARGFGRPGPRRWSCCGG